MVVHQNVLDSIGNTPLVELTRFETGRCRLFAKLENQNPAGSIKDRIGLVLSGGNIDARLLASILQRGLVRAGRLVRLRIEISDIPGALSKIAGIIGEQGGNIVEVHHQRLFHDVPVKLAEVDAVIETRNAVHVGELVAALIASGFPTRLLSSTAMETR